PGATTSIRIRGREPTAIDEQILNLQQQMEALSSGASYDTDQTRAPERTRASFPIARDSSPLETRSSSSRSATSASKGRVLGSPRRLTLTALVRRESQSQRSRTRRSPPRC